MNNDLTKGNIRKKLVVFCMPLLLSCIFQQLYSVADGIVVGKFISDDITVSENALAAVGASTPISLLFVAVATGTSIGVTVLLSHLFGAKKYSDIKTAFYTISISMIAVGAVLTAIGYIFNPDILKLLNTETVILDDAVEYINIYITGTVFLVFYNVCSGAFTALGDSRTPFYLLLLSSVLNIILDCIFVINLNAGVAGAGYATVISQVTVAVLGFILIRKRLWRLYSGKSLSKFHLPLLSEFLRLAVPGIFQQSFVALGNLLIQSIINSYDIAVVAGFFAGLKLNAFIVTAFMAVANGISAFIAQNYGSGDIKRVFGGIKNGFFIMLSVSIPVAVSFFAFAQQLISIFVLEDSVEAINVGALFLQFVSVFYPIIVVKVTLDCGFRGIGKMKYFTASTVIDLIIRVLLSFVFNKYMGYIGICYAWVIGWTVAGLLSVLFYLKVRKGLMREMPPTITA